MSRTPTIHHINGQHVYPANSLIARINRNLAELIPYRQLYYNYAKKDYYVRIISTNPAEHLHETGPYWLQNLIGLADMLNVWTLPERNTNKAILYKGDVIQPLELKAGLRFPVVTSAYQKMVEQLQAKGYTVTPPQRPADYGLVPAPDALECPAFQGTGDLCSRCHNIRSNHTVVPDTATVTPVASQLFAPTPPEPDDTPQENEEYVEATEEEIERFMQGR